MQASDVKQTKNQRILRLRPLQKLSLKTASKESVGRQSGLGRSPSLEANRKSAVTSAVSRAPLRIGFPLDPLVCEAFFFDPAICDL